MEEQKAPTQPTPPTPEPRVEEPSNKFLGGIVTFDEIEKAPTDREKLLLAVMKQQRNDIGISQQLSHLQAQVIQTTLDFYKVYEAAREGKSSSVVKIPKKKFVPYIQAMMVLVNFNKSLMDKGVLSKDKRDDYKPLVVTKQDQAPPSVVEQVEVTQEPSNGNS